MSKILIIQTSFLGDVILATSLIESFAIEHKSFEIHMLVRKGNEGLLSSNPNLKKVWIWDKSKKKISSLLRLAEQIRKERFAIVINPHRFASSGLITFLSGAKTKSGFESNPFSFCFTHKSKHSFDGKHEIERNHQLIRGMVDSANPSKPRLYPSISDQKRVQQWQSKPYFCLAPTSVWFTKQWPADKWIELINLLPSDHQIYLLGAPSDKEVCERIKLRSDHKMIHVLAGELTLLQSAALMSKARMNYVNDSGPMHLASATNAPVNAIFCSTIPEFGFGPLSDNSKISQIETNLECRPCGIHGHQSCPKGHFKCALEIDVNKLFTNIL